MMRVAQRRPGSKNTGLMSVVRTTCRVAVPILFFPMWILAQTASIPPQPTKVAGATSYVYKSIGGVELRLHVFNPRGGGTVTQRPAILFFFGGGWTEGSVEQFARQARHLTQGGMVSVLVDYRVFGRHGTSPFEGMADAKSAVRWVRSHSAELGIDPKRIAASGGSAGGHLALSTAVFDTFDEPREDKTISSKPNALVLFNPAVDTTHTKPAEYKERFGARAREGSPLHHLGPGLPPMLILNGKADQVVPYSDVERFCGEARRLGNQCQLVGYEGAPHGFFNQPRWYQETLQEADRFLAQIGYLEARVPARGR